MPILTGGGAQVTSTNIVDGEIINADIATAAAIAQSKIAGLLGNPGTFVSIETTDGATHSLTTVANQRVLVIAQINIDVVVGDTPAILAYNGVTKATSTLVKTSTDGQTQTLFYTEVPGAGTQNVTITASGATVTGARIVVIKVQETA